MKWIGRLSLAPALAGFPVVLASTLLPFLLSCSSSPAPQLHVDVAGSSWITAWGNSPENANNSTENPGGSEQSFRFFFLPTVAGTQERVHLSNFFGTAPITIGAARLAVAPGGSAAIDPSRDARLTFSGNSSVTIPPGQEVVSDPAFITYDFGQKMAVSMYVKGTFPSLTQHESQVTLNYATPTGAGDKTSDTGGGSFTQTNTEWYLLSGVDTYGPYAGTVALIGSSNVDGHASNYGNTNSYPVQNAAIPAQDNDRPSDWLARQLATAGYNNIGVLNAGVLGDPAGPNSVTDNPNSGVATGIDRIDRDVLQRVGVKAVVILFGGIDLRSADCKSAPEIENSLSIMVAKANAAGIRVILGTVPPAEYCFNPAATNFGAIPSTANPYGSDINPGPENPGATQRRILNTWIRNAGAQLPGVVSIADFDKVLANPAHPDFMIDNLNSGDNFHPNGVGYGVQSSAIQLSSILGK